MKSDIKPIPTFHLEFSASLLSFRHSFLPGNANTFRNSASTNFDFQLARAKIELIVWSLNASGSRPKVRMGGERKYLLSLIHCLKFRSINIICLRQIRDKRNLILLLWQHVVWFATHSIRKCELKCVPFSVLPRSVPAAHSFLRHRT